jgi:hypothetical protein
MSKKKIAISNYQQFINAENPSLFPFADCPYSFLKLFCLVVRSVEMTL